ncbi:telomeric repeat-binding factor 2-interacting protein 1-like isoform X2 [Mustelus asterias]
MAASTSRQTPTHSRTLFLGSEGVPLRFYVRPGPTKASLFPLIVHGGGVMCRHREWGAVLLTELEETGPPPKGYTTARYVLDCVEKNEQLPLEDYGGQRACPPRAEVRQAQPRAGKKNPDSRQHIDREEAAASVERVSDGVNSEEECFNIFPVAIREFEVEDDTPELVNIGDELETKKVSQEQQMETDKPLQVNPAKHCPKHKETLAGFVMHNEQSELDSQTPVDELSSLPTASQDEVECAIKAINTLMQTHNLDLCAATQLLLKNSGELSAALHFMETGHRPDGYPIWTHRDDLDLEKADRKVQERLIQKFGSDNLAKRIAFRKS